MTTQVFTKEILKTVDRKFINICIKMQKGERMNLSYVTMVGMSNISGEQ